MAIPISKITIGKPATGTRLQQPIHSTAKKSSTFTGCALLPLTKFVKITNNRHEQCCSTRQRPKP